MRLDELVEVVAVPFDHLLDFEAFEKRQRALSSHFFADLATVARLDPEREFDRVLLRVLAKWYADDNEWTYGWQDDEPDDEGNPAEAFIVKDADDDVVGSFGQVTFGNTDESRESDRQYRKDTEYTVLLDAMTPEDVDATYRRVVLGERVRSR